MYTKKEETYQQEYDNFIKAVTKSIMDFVTSDESKIVDFKGKRKQRSPSEIAHKAFMLPKELWFEDNPDVTWCKYIAIKIDTENEVEEGEACFIDEEGYTQTFSSTLPIVLIEIADNIQKLSYGNQQ